MENVDLVVALAEITQSNKRVMRVMRGDTKMWPSTDDVLVWVDAEHITSTIATSKREAGSSLEGTLLPNMGCAMVSMVVTMGGVDITEDAYDSSDGSISIEEVTDDVVISAIASPVIVFADSTVKSLCVSNWGGNYLQGEITEYEAAQVTRLNAVFMGNTQITSFDELRFFTGLTTFNTNTGSSSQGEFYNCRNLTSIVLPQVTLTENVGYPYPQAMFRYCPNIPFVDLSPVQSSSRGFCLYHTFHLSSALQSSVLKKVILPKGAYYSSAGNAFAYQKGLTTIEIDGTADWSEITALSNAFNNCTSLTTITGTIVGISQDIDLHWSPLTRASAMVLINGLAQTSSPKKITFSWATYNLLSDDDIAIANSKGWNVETYVQFEDANLKAFILEQFPDNVGKTTANEITNLELGSITSLGGKFRGLVDFNSDSSKPFYTFNELRFFTGLTSLYISGNSTVAVGEFNACTNLTSVKIPKANITNISGAFFNTKLTEIDLSPIQSSVGMHKALHNVTTLTKVVLPTSVATMVYTFRTCNHLTTLDATNGSDWSGVTSSVNGFNNTFNSCSALTTIIGSITGISVSIDFHWSPLTRASALVVLNGLTQVQTAQKVTFSYSTYNLLTDADIAIATAKNWQVETIVVFDDANVKNLLLQNFPNNVGLAYANEITNLELATITSLNGVFRGNTNITSFDELRFFTGLTGFTHPANNDAQGEFYNCTSLQSITFPNIQLQDADLMGLLRNCNSLKSFDLTPIKANAYHINYMLYLASTNALENITLPSGYYGGGFGVLSCARYAMRDCNQMTTLKINGVADWSGISSYQESNVSTSMFYRCSSLTTIIGVITGIKADLYMKQCPLTADSAMIILNGLADLTGKTSKTLTLSSTTKSALTAAGIDYNAIATAKNWQVASA